jgi:hypothetical protein
MRCPFGRPHPPKLWGGPTTIVSGDYMDYMEEIDDRAQEAYWTEYNAFAEKYPTCWDKFLNLLGVK